MPSDPTRRRDDGDVEVTALSSGRWSDLERLFGPRGAVGGCWCMDRRLPRSEFEAGRGDGNRRRLQALAARPLAPGLIGYVDGEPAGWAATGPRQEFPVLDRSPVVRGLRDPADWVVACLFVAPTHRRSGVGTALLRGAVRFARESGAIRIEGYPVDRPGRDVVDVFAFTGIASQFADAGFVEVARFRPTRPVMRRQV